MNEKSFRPLARHLLSKVVLAALLCLALVGVLETWLTYQLVVKRYRETAQQVVQATVPALSRQLWMVERDHIQVLLDGLVKASRWHGIGAAVVRDRNGGEPIRSGDAGLASYSESIVAALPHPAGRDDIGELSVVLDPRVIYREVALTVVAVLVGTGLVMLLVAAVVMLILRREVHRPLLSLASFVRGLDAGEVDRPLDLRRPQHQGRDEIDELADGFRDLQARLVTHIDTLETQVAERTAHLEDALARLRRVATTDSLTACYNRAYFTEQLPRELARAQRHGRPLSVAFCDVDHFKQINDRHGHAMGDQVLSAVGDCLRQLLRSGGDWVARYGGEEFVLVLPETTLSQAAVLAERMRQAVSQQIRLPLETGGTLGVTMSLGLAQWLCGESEDSLLKRADACLYAAKRQGRNRVCMGAAEGV